MFDAWACRAVVYIHAYMYYICMYMYVCISICKYIYIMHIEQQLQTGIVSCSSVWKEVLAGGRMSRSRSRSLIKTKASLFIEASWPSAGDLCSCVSMTTWDHIAHGPHM